MGRQRGFFLTESLDNHGLEWRAYTRDPDRHLIKADPPVSKTAPVKLPSNFCMGEPLCNTTLIGVNAAFSASSSTLPIAPSGRPQSSPGHPTK
jgi:hypothetical protein